MNIVAEGADDHVRLGCAGQGIVEGRADQVLDAVEGVARGVAAAGRAGREIDASRRRR